MRGGTRVEKDETETRESSEGVGTGEGRCKREGNMSGVRERRGGKEREACWRLGKDEREKK